MPAEIPRLFYLRSEPAGEQLADGVQWPDGTVTVNWTGSTDTAQWTSFADPAAAIVHTERVTVVWRLQDTYATPRQA